MKLYSGSIEHKGVTRSGPKGGKRQFSTQRGLPLALVIAAGLIGPKAMNAQAAPQVGQLVASGLTVPDGGAWINGNLGGHFWQPDNALGVCRIDNGAVSTAPNACSTTAKAGGQVVVADPAPGFAGLPAGAKFLFVSDASSKSNQVVRYVIDPATETIKSTLTIQVLPPTNVGGGTNGARAVGIALAPNKADLFVGYIKSGDIMKITNATGTTGNPTVGKIGSTSDGKGINSMALFGNDLYLAELGGTTPLSYIPDPSGIAGPACTSSSPSCIAKTPPGLPNGLPPNPAGITTDANVTPAPAAVSLYLGDSPLTGITGIGIVKWTPSTGAVSTYSTDINPTYQGSDGVHTNTYTKYANPTGLAFAPNGDLYVADDPSFRCALPTCAAPPTNQGHLWKVSPTPAAPTVTSVAPNQGVPEGGTVVAISGTGFSTAAGGTSVSFVSPAGSASATGVTCSSTKACSATSPAGTGTVDVVVNVAGLQSATAAADQFTYQSVTITSLSPNFGSPNGTNAVTINGTGFSTAAGATTVSFGGNRATAVTCSSTTACSATAPAGTGSVNVTVTVSTGTTSDTSNALPYAYVAGTAPTISSLCVVKNSSNPAGTCAGTTGATNGGTMVNLTGSNLANATVTFGGAGATVVGCADGTTCTVMSPASPTGGAGTVGVVATVGAQSSQPASFTYQTPAASVWAFGITAPKGGMIWIPNAQGGGHWWSSDHANGFCRQDLLPSPVGSSKFALNYAVCDDGTIGSSGQAAYDSANNFIFVPDNAVKSTAVWRLPFDPSTETVGAPVGMVPLADVRTLKPNGMALGPGPNGTALYVTDLTEMNIRRIDFPSGNPRLQTITIIGTTGDARGANGTIGFLGNKLYISENRAASWFDVTKCTDNSLTPCSTATTSASTATGITGTVPLPGGVFVAGVATDPVHNLVYAADSPGGAAATIWRWNPATPTVPGVVYLQGGTTPNPGSTYFCAQTCTRPTDNFASSTAFSFAFGINVDPNSGDLFVTEDATAGARSGRGRAWNAPFVP